MSIPLKSRNHFNFSAPNKCRFLFKPIIFVYSCKHGDIILIREYEKGNTMSFLDVNIIRVKGKFTTSVYHKPTLAEFIPILTVCYQQFNTIQALLYRCFRICSDRTKFHLELGKLIDAFKSNGYPENFINNCFKVFLNNKYRSWTIIIAN